MPRSLFDRPSSLLRRDAKMVKLKQSMALKSGGGLKQPSSSQLLQRPLPDAITDQPEWLIHEDWALLQVRGARAATAGTEKQLKHKNAKQVLNYICPRNKECIN